MQGLSDVEIASNGLGTINLSSLAVLSNDKVHAAFLLNLLGVIAHTVGICLLYQALRDDFYSGICR